MGVKNSSDGGGEQTKGLERPEPPGARASFKVTAKYNLFFPRPHSHRMRKQTIGSHDRILCERGPKQTTKANPKSIVEENEASFSPFLSFFLLLGLSDAFHPLWRNNWSFNGDNVQGLRRTFDCWACFPLKSVAGMVFYSSVTPKWFAKTDQLDRFPFSASLALFTQVSSFGNLAAGSFHQSPLVLLLLNENPPKSQRETDRQTAGMRIV